ncbi:MAG TPA: 5-(carboxyamino)imidazole ribonucleotide mutase [Synergistaceae bacterium]|nr:5-(carboxyamino)imidazole ribonucleotide mutase [Synergistaceae bacterium]
MHFRRDIGARARTARPRVGVLLGSASDLPLAQEAAEIFRALDIPFEVTVASAHRTPDHVAAYAASAQKRGLRVLLAVAGLSAALPGVVAAHTLLPVLGVPVASGSLGGLDALLAVTQMPPGVPVGSLGVGGGKNAALLAARILALHQPGLGARLQAWHQEASDKVLASRKKMGDLPQPPAEAFFSAK